MNTQIDINKYFTAEKYSPWSMCKVVNKVLADAGVVKVLPPQMFYIYTSPDKKYIATVDGDASGKGRQVLRETAVNWTQKYLLKQLALASVEAQLAEM